MKNPEQISENRKLGPLTTFEVGGAARYFIEIESEAAAVTALRFAHDRGIPFLVIGGGSNMLISDEGFPGLVILNRIKGISTSQEGSEIMVSAGAGEDWQVFSDRCTAEGWSGVECMAGIPGTVGAAPVQNIGAYGQEAADCIVNVRAIDADSLSPVLLSREECGFEYRSSIFSRAGYSRYLITGVEFRLRRNAVPELKYRQLAEMFSDATAVTPQAVRDAVLEMRAAKGLLVRDGYETFRSAGSFFKNPVVPAEAFAQIERRVNELGGCRDWAWPLADGSVKLSAACLMQSAGFGRGYRQGNAGISPRHALILINYGGATATEIARFAATVQQRVEQEFGVLLCPEVRLIGFSEGLLK